MDTKFDQFVFVPSIMKFCILILLIWFQNVAGMELSTESFIEKFIYSELAPTFLSLRRVCWGKMTLLNTVKNLSQAGIRSTMSSEQNHKYLMHQTLFLADLDCSQMDEVLSNASSSKHFDYPYRWLLLTSEERNNENLRELPLTPSSELVLASKENNSFTINEWYKTSVNSPLITNHRGIYNGEYIDMRPAKELFRRRKNLFGHSLTISNVIQDSNTTRYHLEDRLESQYDTVSKVCWLVTKLAFQMLNATPRNIFSHRWGYKQNGQWSGMIDDLFNERADLGSNCAMYSSRLDVAEFTDTIAPFKVRFIFRQPPLPYVANIFTLPFSTELWIAVAACLTLSTVTLYLTSKLEVRFIKSPCQPNGTIKDAMLVIVSAFSQQGCSLEPKRASGRMVLWVAFTALMALYAAYSANIVVLLQAPSSAVKNLKQLAESKITLAANDIDYNRFIFDMYSDPLRVEIGKRVKPPKGKRNFYHINEGVERMRQGLFAFHSIVEPVYRRVEETFNAMEKCDLVEVDFMVKFDPFVPVKRDSPYLELLRVSFKQIRESGLQSALNKRQQVSKPQCTHRAASFSSVGLLDLRPVLTLMVYGVAISVVILLIEIITYKIYLLRENANAVHNIAAK